MEVLFILLIVVLISIYLFKRFWPLIIRFVLKKMQQKMQNRYNQANQKQENKHTTSRNKNSNSNSTDHLGEYVDYEEID